ncbi:hypothetical protein SUGI_0206050 [Cryptomeria japonica]|nr:hypothetical protein SUGI_0206050 [Cryptomeria japonica]
MLSGERVLTASHDGVGNKWDIRSGKQMHKLLGHTKWIRSMRMVGDIIITRSDDWTARLWFVSRGTCDVVLAFHAGPITCVEYSTFDKGIITGSTNLGNSRGLIAMCEKYKHSFIRYIISQGWRTMVSYWCCRYFLVFVSPN